jgi:hypothetical protein
MNDERSVQCTESSIEGLNNVTWCSVSDECGLLLHKLNSYEDLLMCIINLRNGSSPITFLQVRVGVGKPSAWQWKTAASSLVTLRSLGSDTHRGGTATSYQI